MSFLFSTIITTITIIITDKTRTFQFIKELNWLASKQIWCVHAETEGGETTIQNSESDLAVALILCRTPYAAEGGRKLGILFLSQHCTRAGTACQESSFLNYLQPVPPFEAQECF